MTVAVSRGWPAPAKLNLCLYVTGRRPDGYHELQTAFQLLDWSDELHFTVTHEPRVRRLAVSYGVLESEDLVVRAANALKSWVGRADLGVDIEVIKRLPGGAGLGGGSSDAATTLVALNHLWGLHVPGAELERLGGSLGADVPVFVRGYSAWAEGVGEKLTVLDLPPATYLVIFPGTGMSTAQVFQAPELTRNSPRITMTGFLERLQGDPLTQRLLSNDLEPVVRSRHEGVREALQWLAIRGFARMTGSGACVFAAFESATQAEQALQELPARWQGWVVTGVNRSPLWSRFDVES